MKNIFKWVYLIGLLVAIVAALVKFQPGWFLSLMMVVAVLVGIFYFETGDLTNLGIRFLALFAVAGSLDKLMAVGSYLTTIFSAVVGFLGPAVLAVLVMFFVKKYFLGKK